MLVNIRKRFQRGLENQLLLVEVTRALAIPIQSDFEVFVMELNRPYIVVEIPFTSYGSYKGVVAYKLDMHESSGSQLGHRPPHHLRLTNRRIIPLPSPRINGGRRAIRARLVPFVLRVLPASNQVSIDNFLNPGTILFVIY